MKIQHHILYVLLVIFFNSSALAAELSKKVDITLAAQLVKLSLVGTSYEGAAFDAPSKDSKEDFFVFEILGKYEGILTGIAVNSWTGDVWNMDECKILSNSETYKIQTKIKHQFYGDQSKEYEQLQQLRPYRRYNLEPC